jgi:hypothetical protein
MANPFSKQRKASKRSFSAFLHLFLVVGERRERERERERGERAKVKKERGR